jgi:uncharacterized cupredoxin-like copper-binding protein
MRKWAVVLAALLTGLLASLPVPAMAVPTTVTVVLEPTQVRTVLGGRFTLETEVTNAGSTATGALLAHLNVASIEGSVYVDPEDWSADRSQEVELQPGESRRLTWEVQAVNSGSFAAYVVVLPFGSTTAAAENLAVTPLAKLEVAPRFTLNPRGALPVVLLVPVLLGVLATATRLRLRTSPRALSS